MHSTWSRRAPLNSALWLKLNQRWRRRWTLVEMLNEEAKALPEHLAFAQHFWLQQLQSCAIQFESWASTSNYRIATRISQSLYRRSHLPSREAWDGASGGERAAAAAAACAPVAVGVLRRDRRERRERSRRQNRAEERRSRALRPACTQAVGYAASAASATRGEPRVQLQEHC